MTEPLKVIPGSKVALRIGLSDSYTLLTVSKVGKYIELENRAKYKLDGTPLNKVSNRNSIEIVTQEILQVVKKQKLIGKLARLGYNEWKSMSLDKLDRIAKIVEED